MSSDLKKTDQQLGEEVVSALIHSRFDAAYLSDTKEVIRHLISIIPENATIGIGGSKTLETLGIAELLQDRGHTIFWHNQPGLAPDVSMAYRHSQLSCDVFLTSTNALTLKGELVNKDGIGNRVAAMFFGPKKVIVIAGVNKIVADLNAAEERIRTVAAPLNNKRLNRPNPCVKTGVCMDCQGPTRICNVTTIISKRPPATDVTVLVVGEALGF